MREKILTPEEMLKLAETKDGRAVLKDYVLRARVAFSVQRVFETLKVVPPPEVQEECSQIVYDSIRRVDLDVVMRWAKEAAAWYDSTHADVVGSC